MGSDHKLVSLKLFVFVLVTFVWIVRIETGTKLRHYNGGYKSFYTYVQQLKYYMIISLANDFKIVNKTLELCPNILGFSNLNSMLIFGFWFWFLVFCLFLISLNRLVKWLLKTSYLIYFGTIEFFLVCQCWLICQ